MLYSHSFSQVTERGFVKEYNERQEKTPLGMVELKVLNAGTTTSSEDGSFILQFRTMKPGDKVNLLRIYKEGYELFNTESVKQWNISNSGKPFEIVMCNSKRFKNIYDRYAKTTYDCYARQQKVEEEKLEHERLAGVLKEKEYQHQLLVLREDYNKKLDNIDNYIDRFARIDLTSLSDKEADILETIQQGNIDKAIQLYDDMKLEDKMLKCSQQITKATESIGLLHQQQEKTREERDSIFQIFLRNIDVLQLIGGADNYAKIRQRMKAVADQDTNFITPVLYYAVFANDQHLYSDCEHYTKIAERKYKNIPCDTLLKIYEMLGKIEEHKINYTKAIDYYKKGLHVIEALECDTCSKYSWRTAVLSNLINAYIGCGDFQNAMDCHQENISVAQQLAKIDSTGYDAIYEGAKNNYALFLRDIGNYQKADSIWFSSNDQLREKFERDSTEYELIYMLNEVNIALSLIAQGKRDNVENMLTKWIDTAQKEAIKDPNSSADFLQMIREGLISYYAMTKETEKLLNISRDIEKDFQKLVIYNPQHFTSQLVASQHNLGHYFTDLGKNNVAIDILEKALINVEELKEYNPQLYYEHKTSILVNIGVAHMKVGKTELAEQDWLSAISYAKKRTYSDESSFSRAVVRAYGNLGILYFKQNRFDLAEEYLMQFLEYVENVPNNIKEYGSLLVYALETMEEISLMKGDLVDALAFVRPLIDIAEKQGDAKKKAVFCLSASQLLWNIKEKRKARKWWKEAEIACPEYVKENGVELRKLLFGK